MNWRNTQRLVSSCCTNCFRPRFLVAQFFSTKPWVKTALKRRETLADLFHHKFVRQIPQCHSWHKFKITSPCWQRPLFPGIRRAGRIFLSFRPARRIPGERGLCQPRKIESDERKKEKLLKNVSKTTKE